MYRGECPLSTHTSQTKPAGLYQCVPTHNSLLGLPVSYGDMYRGECPLSTHTSQTKHAGLYQRVPTHNSLLGLLVSYGDLYKGECPLSTHTSQTKPAGLYQRVPTHNSLLGLPVCYGDLYRGECPLSTHTSQTKPAGPPEKHRITITTFCFKLLNYYISISYASVLILCFIVYLFIKCINNYVSTDWIDLRSKLTSCLHFQFHFLHCISIKSLNRGVDASHFFLNLCQLSDSEDELVLHEININVLHKYTYIIKLIKMYVFTIFSIIWPHKTKKVSFLETLPTYFFGAYSKFFWGIWEFFFYSRVFLMTFIAFPVQKSSSKKFLPTVRP